MLHRLPLQRLLIAPLLLPGIVFGQATDIDDQEIQQALQVMHRVVQHMALNPFLVKAVRRQNAEELSIETITSRDQQWQTSKKLDAFKLSLQNNQAGRFLRTEVRQQRAINEAFLTDAQGANVAAYPATSDYWQGDEEKWSASFNKGKGIIIEGPLEKDESTNTQAVQISAPVLDRGKTIGVLIVGITLEYIQTKRATQ